MGEEGRVIFLLIQEVFEVPDLFVARPPSPRPPPPPPSRDFALFSTESSGSRIIPSALSRNLVNIC